MRLLARAALLPLILLLAACQTAGGPVAGKEAGSSSGLPNASFDNVTAVEGVR